MSTTQATLDNVRNRRLPYWKLYKGSQRVSQCDREENPTGDPEIAIQLFEEELQTRLYDPGTYRVNVYRAINGEKGGFQYHFTISATTELPRMNNLNRSSYDYDDIRKSVEREVKMFMMLEDISKKVDAIGEFILSRTTEDKGDDNEALKLLLGAFSAMRNKAALPVKSGGFSGL